MIRVDAIWLATAPMDMRAGPDTALAVNAEVILPISAEVKFPTPG
jgi:hypothetical protein